MSTIQETAVWPPTIKQLDTTDPVLGGGTGASNLPLQALANRTAYLKAQVEAKADAAHTHAIAGVVGLQDALDLKSAYNHTHAIAGVTGLQAALDAKAPYVHAHGIGDTTGLQAALDAKALATHTHGMSGIAGLQAALDAKAALAHTHAIADVTGLQAALVDLPNRLAFGQGQVAHGGTVPLPYYKDGTRATAAQIVLLDVSKRIQTNGSGGEATQWSDETYVDPGTLVVTARKVIALGGGGANSGANGTANYTIICMR